MKTAEKVVKKLIEEKKTISTMESCTSGLIASMITDTEGASAIFPGGFVTYSNEVKEQVGVNKGCIEKYGVYSRECAVEMAKDVKSTLHTDIAIGITGTTGNVDPNNSDSVQGEVFYCIIVDDEECSYKLHLDVSNKSRREIKQIYGDDVFQKLWELLQ